MFRIPDRCHWMSNVIADSALTALNDIEAVLVKVGSGSELTDDDRRISRDAPTRISTVVGKVIHAQTNVACDTYRITKDIEQLFKEDDA